MPFKSFTKTFTILLCGEGLLLKHHDSFPFEGPTNLSGVQNQRISEVDETEIQNRIGTGDEPCVTSKGQLRNGLYKQGGKSSFTNDRGKDG